MPDPCVNACQDALDAALLAVSQVENLLATTGLLGLYDPDYVSYDVGVFPDPAPVGTVGAYFPVAGILQLLRSIQLQDDPTPGWTPVGPAIVLENNRTAHLRASVTLAAALAKLPSGGTLTVDATYTLRAGDTAPGTSTVTIPKGVALNFVGGGSFTVPTGKTLRVDGDIHDAGRVQRFSGDGDIYLPGAQAVFPEWFGAVQGGSVDCSPAFQRSVTAVGSLGPPVTLRPVTNGGVYRLASEVFVGPRGAHDQFSLISEGGYAALSANPLDPNPVVPMRSLFHLDAEGPYFQHISFNCGRKAMHALHQRRSIYGRIHDCFIGDALSDAIHNEAHYDQDGNGPDTNGNNDYQHVRNLFMYGNGTFFCTPTSLPRYTGRVSFPDQGTIGPYVLQSQVGNTLNYLSIEASISVNSEHN